MTTSAEAIDLISINEAAELLMIGPERIRQLCKLDEIPRGKRGLVSRTEAVQGYIRFLKSRQPPQGSATDRLKEIKARREELRLAREERELVPLADALHAMDMLSGAVSLQINNLPARFTRDLPERDRLQEHIDHALTAVANHMATHASSLRMEDAHASVPAPAEPEDDTEA